MSRTIAAQINELLLSSSSQEGSDQILSLLRSLPPDDLAAGLPHVDIARLLSRMESRRWGSGSRKELLRLLTPTVEHLSRPCKIELIRGLAEGYTHLPEEQLIRELFLSESGQSLTQLKIAIDCATNGHDLLHILSSDIDSADIRFDIIQHFQKASQALPKGDERPLRVISDIDDTIYCSLNDPRHSKGFVYPGALELLAELSEYPPVFLTARPEFAASLFERVTHKQLRKCGIDRCTVLSGSIPGLFGHRRMAEQKARTLTQFRELYPELRFLFIGDSGQGDYALSLSVLSGENHTIECALIHRLAPGQPGSDADHPRIRNFENYHQAAGILHEWGYLNPEQLSKLEQHHPGLNF